MKLGAEPKKVGALAGLLVAAAVIFYINSGSPDPGSSGSSSTTTPPPVVRPVAPDADAAFNTPSAAASARRARANVLSDEFKPTLKNKRVLDPATADPTLKLDILAKLNAVKVEGTRRNVFEFGTAPPPPPTPAEQAAAKAKKPVTNPLVAETKAAPEAPKEPVKPPPAPIPLKFYGYINPASQPVKRAFFLEGEEIHVAHEGDVILRKYRIVRIGINSVVVEDMESKNQQTLPLEEGQPG